jgi:hypothetical protein
VIVQTAAVIIHVIAIAAIALNNTAIYLMVSHKLRECFKDNRIDHLLIS